MDSWSQCFVRPNAEFGQSESVTDLRATALFVQEDQAAVECGFARVRRSLKFHSVHAHQEHIEYCNVHWCAGSFRRGCAPPYSSSAQRKSCFFGNDESDRPAKTRNISTWNAFVHQHTVWSAMLPDLSNMCGEYSELRRDGDAWQTLTDVAIQGTSAVIEGARPFGPSSREIQRSHSRAAGLYRAIVR